MRFKELKSQMRNTTKKNVETASKNEIQSISNKIMVSRAEAYKRLADR